MHPVRFVGGVRVLLGLSSTLALALLTSCIGPPIVISVTTLDDAIEGRSYSQILQADTTATWQVSGGALPSGMRVSNDGVLSGTPTETGSFSFTVRATASNGLANRTGSQTYTLVVIPRLILTVNLAIPQVGVSYSDAVEAAGGTPPYVFSVVGLTAGLTLDEATGALTGTPLSPTSGINVQFTVTDSGGVSEQTDSQLIMLEINPAPIVFVTTSLPNGSVGTAYGETIEIDEGQGPFTFTVTAGVLPDGLSLDRSTGRISGTPSTTQTSTFTVQVVDSEEPPNEVSQEFTITVE